ncbi:MAG: hypothetical protein Q9M32_08810 [Sulfurimonas sp.]|nr:hypothetical protein [Sulfurimonas sp.]
MLGASWAIVFFGALITFKTFLVLGLGLAFFFTILFIFVGLFLILLLDSFSVNRARLVEAKKQTKLLEKLYSKNIHS